jgi:arabinofuranosyltransferase
VSVALLTLMFFAVLLRTAWLSDDALITLRTVLNVTHGFGLTFNIAERVQTFTHPLWMALLTASYLAVGNVYIATFALSIATSLAVFWIAVRRAASPAQMWIAAAALLFSRAFVDYSTSGLENPLSNLLIAAFALAAVRAAGVPHPPVAGAWLIGSLLYLTRPDDVLLVAPALAVLTWRAGIRAWRRVAIGVSPAVGWTLFALFYYGSPLPNTAWAKLATGIPRSEMWRQGLLYLLDSIDRDPVTLVTVALAIAAGVAVRGLPRQLAAGLALYLVYVVIIGGDFMSGRFLATPLYGAVWVLAGLVAFEARHAYAAAAMLAVIGLASAQIPLLSDSRFRDAGAKTTGIIDERAIYFGHQSLVRASRRSFVTPAWPRARDGAAPFRLEETCGLLGAGGLGLGPHTHLLDDCALADPLLARLPAMFNTNWRPGHFRRLIPQGYRESLQASANQLADEALRPLYDDLVLATRSRPLWSMRRFRAIWRLNTGRHRGAVDRRFYRHGGSIVPLDALSSPRPDETTWDAPGTYVLRQPLAIACADQPGRRRMEASLDSNDRYVFIFLKRNHVVAELEIGPIPEYRRRPGLATYREDLPLEATRDGFDTIVVAGLGGDELYSIGHLRIDGPS